MSWKTMPPKCSVGNNQKLIFNFYFAFFFFFFPPPPQPKPLWVAIPVPFPRSTTATASKLPLSLNPRLLPVLYLHSHRNNLHSTPQHPDVFLLCCYSFSVLGKLDWLGRGS